MKHRWVAGGLGLLLLASCGDPGTDEPAPDEVRPTDDGTADPPEPPAPELPAPDLPTPELPSGRPESQVVEERAVTWDVDPEVAELRIRLQDAGAEVNQALREHDPDLYAGGSIDEAGVLVYAFTAEAPAIEAAILDAYARAGVDREHVRFEVRDHSINELEARQDRAMVVVRREATRFGIDAWGVGTDNGTGVTYVDLNDAHPAFEQAVQDALEHEVRFRTDGAPVEAG